MPGGLIERMNAMIFHRSSEVLMVMPIGGIGFSKSAEPSVTSLNSTSSVLPQNQTPCVKGGQMPPPPVPP